MIIERWALRLEDIDLFNRCIYVKNVDRPGGRNYQGKSFRLVSNVKAGKEGAFYMSEKCAAFLKDDLSKRVPKERWFLDAGDGSNKFSYTDNLGKVFDRIQRKLRISGEAKRPHGSRTTLATDLCKTNPRDAQQQLRHEDISTTIEA